MPFEFKRGVPALAPEAQAEWVRQNSDRLRAAKAALTKERDELRAALTDARDALEQIAQLGTSMTTPPHWPVPSLVDARTVAREVLGRLDQESGR